MVLLLTGALPNHSQRIPELRFLLRKPLLIRRFKSFWRNNVGFSRSKALQPRSSKLHWPRISWQRQNEISLVIR